MIESEIHLNAIAYRSCDEREKDLLFERLQSLSLHEHSPLCSVSKDEVSTWSTEFLSDLAGIWVLKQPCECMIFMDIIATLLNIANWPIGTFEISGDPEINLAIDGLIGASERARTDVRDRIPVLTEYSLRRDLSQRQAIALLYYLEWMLESGRHPEAVEQFLSSVNCNPVFKNSKCDHFLKRFCRRMEYCYSK